MYTMVVRGNLYYGETIKEIIDERNRRRALWSVPSENVINPKVSQLWMTLYVPTRALPV